jgi:hypothetical protein
MGEIDPQATLGLEEEARRLELAMSALPPEQRGCVSAGPSSTD